MSYVMQAFPTAKPNQASLANLRKAPYCHWAFHHVRELIRSTEIQNDPLGVCELERGVFDTSNLGFDKAMLGTDCDAVVMLHEDKLVYESCCNGMTPHDPHILMSVSKSTLGLIEGTLVGLGELAEHCLCRCDSTRFAGYAGWLFLTKTIWPPMAP